MRALVAGIGNSMANSTARRLIKNGYEVVGTYEPNAEGIEELKSELATGFTAISLNHANAAEVRSKLASEGGGFDALVFTHMYFNLEDRKNFDFEQWSISLKQNLTAPMIFISQADSLLNDNAGVVFVTSTEAFRGSFRAAGYAATKAAVHNLVMTAANNLGARGIRVNAVAPGWIGGVMDTDEVFEMSKRITPLERLGSPDEVASAISFLISSDASFVSGTVLVVDGGYSGVDTIAKFEAESSPE